MSNNTAAARLNWVDHAKGIGIILVVFGHVIKGLNTANLIDPVFFNYAVNFVYSFHMPLFFILSGYFFLPGFNKRGNKYFLVNKLETIVYPFIIWVLIQSFIALRLSALTNSHVKARFSLDYFYRPHDQFWFLMALFLINLMCLLFFNISKKWGVLISVIVWVVYYNFPLITDIFDRTYLNLIYFAAGIALSQSGKVTKLLVNNIWAFLFNLVIFASSLYVYFHYPRTAWYNEIFPQLSGSFVVIYLSGLCSNLSFFKFLEYLGINSMAIYLVHILAGSGTRIILATFLHVRNSAVHIVLGTLVGLMASLLLYNVAMKTKYLSWLFIFPLRRKSKHASAMPA
ncbi:acyltransferase family protein [Mucilaginibacter flavidus]|uniref:acyltransferase family protein n=1 Tax=Mucilaginibacter flavidus TaxID=2949309 RepID=UPI0020936737|nr:acyltransferase family protein [Mucilaginibacter flavidus]MCO5950389.1 acyltransferase family protein [Mucilaginibacter flavidus]